MGACCVDGCEPDDDVAYFPVPVAPALRRKWREAIKPTTKLHQDSKICSRHFHTTDYERIRGKLRLKGRVVPSVFNKRDTPSPTSSPLPDTNGTRRSVDKKQNGGEVKDSEGQVKDKDSSQVKDNDGDQDMQDLSVPEFGILEPQIQLGAEADDIAECTIECVPEAILHQESDSNSETELHKEDIEDIIANYHIQQHSKLNARHRPVSASETEHAGEKERRDSKEKDKKKDDEQDTSEKQDPPDKERDKDRNKDGGDMIEIEVEPVKEKRPEFIEISVDSGRKGRRGRTGSADTGGNDDCLLLLENVQVDIDPATLMLSAPDNNNDHNHRKLSLEQCSENHAMELSSEHNENREMSHSFLKENQDNTLPNYEDLQNVLPVGEDPISLLTSSDEDDVIIEEPHIDTVEVSSETDEDDMPLVKLVKTKVKEKPTNLTRLLWGNLTEYYCFQCQFTTVSKAELARHKLKHSRILFVCDVCNFTCTSKGQFSRHKKKHKLEKRFKCNYCGYKARHNMSLVYHMKSHENVSVETIEVKEDVIVNNVMKKYKCSSCKFGTSSYEDMAKHVKVCEEDRAKPKKPKVLIHKCDKCNYSTTRRNDLKRHRERKHIMESDDDMVEG